jgi:hypothetical protein
MNRIASACNMVPSSLVVVNLRVHVWRRTEFPVLVTPSYRGKKKNKETSLALFKKERKKCNSPTSPNGDTSQKK